MNDFRECSPTELSLAQLRAERHELAERVARLSWLRRIVVARTDLEVARLTGAPDAGCGIASAELDAGVRCALALGATDGDDGTAVDTADLLTTLSRTTRTLEEHSRRASASLDTLTEELVARLSADPSRILAGTPAR